MPIPDPLPPQFTATLRARVRALIEHSILDGGRQTVEEPAAGGEPLVVRVEVDREAGTLRLLEFPPVEDEVGTAIGTVRALVTVGGQPEGAYDGETGHARLDVPVDVDPKSMLARDSAARVALSTEGAVDQPELQATGDPLDAGDSVVRLVGHGTFTGGSLDGGTLWLVVDCEVESVEAR